MSNLLKVARELIHGGKADGKPDSKFDKKQIEKGIGVEKEHIKDKDARKEIAKDHLTEDPKYYSHLKEMEDKYVKKAASKSNESISDYIHRVSKDLKKEVDPTINEVHKAVKPMASHFDKETKPLRDYVSKETKPLRDYTSNKFKNVAKGFEKKANILNTIKKVAPTIQHGVSESAHILHHGHDAMENMEMVNKKLH